MATSLTRRGFTRLLGLGVAAFELVVGRFDVLEVDGTISIVPKGAAVHRTKRHFKQLRLP